MAKKQNKEYFKYDITNAYNKKIHELLDENKHIAIDGDSDATWEDPEYTSLKENITTKLYELE